MAAFSFITPFILVAYISATSHTDYEYLPMADKENCNASLNTLENKNFVPSGYAICMDTGLPVQTNPTYSAGQNTRIPYWLIAQFNNEYEYFAMADEKHCEDNINLLVKTRFVATSWHNNPYAICIKTGYPEIK